MNDLKQVCRVCFPVRDGLDVLSGQLALAMRKFFVTGRKTVKVHEALTINGYKGQVRGKISRRSVYWHLKIFGGSGGSVILEEAFGRPNGWMLVTRDFTGIIISRTYFNSNHAWTKSEYYEPWNSTQAKVVFSPDHKNHLVLRQDWDFKENAFRKTRLSLAPYHSGTAVQNLADAQLGQPHLLLTVSTGELCCCPLSQVNQRQQILKESEGASTVLLPAWEVRDGTVIDDEKDSNITFTSLEEYAKIEPDIPASVQPKSTPLPPASTTSEEDFTPVFEEESPVGNTAKAEAGQIHSPSSAGNASESLPTIENEGTSISSAPDAGIDGKSRRSTEQSTESMIDTAEDAPSMQENGVYQEPPADFATSIEKPHEKDISDEGAALTHQDQESTGSTSLDSSTSKRSFATDESSDAFCLSPKKDGKQDSANMDMPSTDNDSNGNTVNAQPAPDISTPQEGIPTSEMPVETLPHAAPVAYQGSFSDGKITGRGRTQQAAGFTSYEGDYVNNKRHGFGAYYFKNGNLCYAGFWKDDRRDGLGVSFRDSDHAMHVANWQDGQPKGLVTLFDKEGGLRFSGRIENGKKEGAGVVINAQDGTVFVGQWSGGQPTGLGSAFDREGRLLYYGQWKNGMRHGHGTEFDSSGTVVFDGEWREGKYYNGVLYQKLEQPNLE